jgi:hypothetical protein
LLDGDEKAPSCRAFLQSGRRDLNSGSLSPPDSSKGRVPGVAEWREVANVQEILGFWNAQDAFLREACFQAFGQRLSNGSTVLNRR